MGQAAKTRPLVPRHYLLALLRSFRRRGEVIFRSDNASALVVLKDFISKEATDKKVRVNTSYDIREETYAAALQLLHPRIEYQLQLSEKAKILEALKANEGIKLFGCSPFLPVSLTSLLAPLFLPAQEIRMQEEGSSKPTGPASKHVPYLSAEAFETLNNADAVEKQLRSQGARLQYLHSESSCDHVRSQWRAEVAPLRTRLNPLLDNFHASQILW